MKLKLDENLGTRAMELFREANHDVATVTEQDLGGASDDALIETCRDEGRALITLDMDFSNVLRFPPNRYAGIAVLRVPHPIKLEDIHERAGTLIAALERAKLPNHLWIVEHERIREYDPEQ